MKIINKKKQASKASKKKTNKKVQKALKTPKLNTKLVLAKPQKTQAYYGCLADKARKGCLTGKIGKMCHECKEKGTELALNRKKEIKTLALAYKQLGLSITELIKH